MIDLMTHNESTGDLDTKVWLACAYLSRLEKGEAS